MRWFWKASCSALLLLPGACGGSDAGGDGALFEVGAAAVAQPPSPTAPVTEDTAPPVALEVTVLRVDIHVVPGGHDADDEADAHDDDQDAAGDDGLVEAGALGPAGEADERSGDGDGFRTVFTGEQRLLLVSGSAVEVPLGSAVVPAGKVTQIRLVLADDAALVEGATKLPVSCPSCTTSGLKIKPKPALVIPDGGALHVTLLFDLEMSVKPHGDGYQLGPVLRLEASAVP